MSNSYRTSNQAHPPFGDSLKAAKYIDKLIELANQDKVTIYHTDLTEFGPSVLQEHYRVDLADYQVEISFSRHPQTRQDSFIILFNNLTKVEETLVEKVILAYMHLDPKQFQDFKSTAHLQKERLLKMEAERKFNDALSPIDQILDKLSEPEFLPEDASLNDSVDPEDFYIKRLLANRKENFEKSAHSINS